MIASDSIFDLQCRLRKRAEIRRAIPRGAGERLPHPTPHQGGGEAGTPEDAGAGADSGNAADGTE